MLELQTLGTVSLRSRDETGSAAQLLQSKRLALLAYLALAPPRRCRRRELVVTLFWPNLDQEHARGALSQALRYLRRVIGDAAIVTQGEDEIGLDRAVVRCDALAFAEHCQANELAAALALYQGSFLEGLFVSDVGPEFEQWVGGERARLRHMALRATRALAEDAECLTDLAAAVIWAQRGVTIAPGDEEVVARLIRLLDQSGNRAAALREYEALRGRLRDEFQVAPSPAIQALVNRILAG